MNKLLISKRTTKRRKNKAKDSAASENNNNGDNNNRNSQWRQHQYPSFSTSMIEDEIVIVMLPGIGAMKQKHLLQHTVVAPWIKDITPSFPA